jgi:formate dehydrogenase gamma subunit
MMRLRRLLDLGVLLLVFPAYAGLKNSDCLDCHSDRTLVITNAAGKAVSLFVDEAKLKASVHRTNTCVGCHADVTVKHPDDSIRLQRVDCGICHEQQTASYHASVHGLALRAGHLDAATCENCHDSHEIAPPNQAASLLYPSRLAETCGTCHRQEVRDWSASVHGKAMAEGLRDAPTCTDCHYEHKITGLKSAGPAVSAEICSRCHASERLNTRYKLPGDRVKTFFESYHGLAAQYGSTVAANCGSCHGYHKILPSTDPDSTVHRAHLVETCGKCHPGADEKFATGKIHVDLTTGEAGADLSDQINWWVRRIYLVLIFGTIGAMFVHNLLLFLRKVAARYRVAVRPVLRMSRAQRWQHFVLAGSFIALAITGFALKFPDSWLARAMGSSEPFRRWSHRIAGVLLLLIGLWHLIYLASSKDGRQLVKDLFPVKKDLADGWCQIGYLLGWSAEKPKIGRFGYAEKMEYWAVIWGTIIMGVTGLMIWFKMDVTHFLPRWAVDVALTIHYYEAILACLAIVVWHFYHVIFDPDVYPINPAFWDGHVSDEWQKHEHPLDPQPGPAAKPGQKV